MRATISCENYERYSWTAFCVLWYVGSHWVRQAGTCGLLCITWPNMTGRPALWYTHVIIIILWASEQNHDVQTHERGGSAILYLLFVSIAPRNLWCANTRLFTSRISFPLACEYDFVCCSVPSASSPPSHWTYGWNWSCVKSCPLPNFIQNFIVVEVTSVINGTAAFLGLAGSSDYSFVEELV